MKNVRKILVFILLACAGFIPGSFLTLAGNQQRGNIPANTLTDTATVLKGIFDIPELTIKPSPVSADSLSFAVSEKVIDYDVSPEGPLVAAIVESTTGRDFIRFWHIGGKRVPENCLLPEGLKARAVAWHPNGNALFVMGEVSSGYQICKVEMIRDDWTVMPIFSSRLPLRRLVVCPRPFIIPGKPEDKNTYYTYRLFFGMDNGDQSWRIVSVTETGSRFYQVAGPPKTFSISDDEFPPSEIEAGWALPVAFHPAGHELIWEDKYHNFFVARYDKAWGRSLPMKISLKNSGTVTPTPNGLGLLHWQKNQPGIGVYLFSTKKEEMQATGFHLISTPSSVPDGKGIVGLTLDNGRYTLNYVPVEVPLADVTNAWMFAASSEEVKLFGKQYGLFRAESYDQLYNLYETENYACAGYSRNSPTRPYLVTTDLFWELFGAAYQGLFIVRERDEAIPNFLEFVNESGDYMNNTGKISAWAPVFDAVRDFLSGNMFNPEARRIQKEEDSISPLTGKQYEYSDLKPRGYYTSTPELGRYFKAFRYLTTIFALKPDTMKELNQLPKDIRSYAEKWVGSYAGFISPSRTPLVWNDLKSKAPAYCQHPGKGVSMFPLSWGFDNEVLNSTVFHNEFPAELQVRNGDNFRLLPSGLDLAAVLGSGFAESLLESDYVRYPPLRKVIDNLKVNYRKNGRDPSQKENLYSQWINALAVQWADTVHSTNGSADKGIWEAKRLQTGLASWATLRHATILVNERSAAECGEGGFEEMLMRAPRGYVEPDPYTFAAIAGLFETAVKYVPAGISGKPDIEDENTTAAKRSLYEGIIARLKEAAGEARAFQRMAEKEGRGEALTNAENEKVLFVARTGEHLFLVFNSLSNKDYALSNPDPIAKIADVAGNAFLSYLMSAVGKPLEWDFVVPFYGRHEIVKGASYAYYEFSSGRLFNDQEWREKVKTQELIPWIKPFFTPLDGSGIPVTCY